MISFVQPRIANFPLEAGFRPALLATLIAAAMSLPAGEAMGQDGAPAEERIVVTGTRIVQPDFVFSNPVTSVSAENLQSSGEINVTGFLTELPALTGSLDSFDTGGDEAFVGGAGLNLLDLRNLGYDRTLVLLNGRRHVATLGEFASVDIGSIPLDLIERIDIMTGGASAVYGADGVTGVVNFILKNDFEGLNVRAQAYSPDESGAATSLISLTYGQNFGRDSRGNFAIAVERTSEERLYEHDRDYNGSRPGRMSYFVDNPAETSEAPIGNGSFDDPAIPDNVPLELIAFGDTSPCGAIFFDGANFPSPDFACDGSPWDLGTLPPQILGGLPDFPISPFYQRAGSGTPFDQYYGGQTILPEIDRTNVNFFLDLELGDSLEFFSEIKWTQSEVFNLGQPTFDFFLFVEPDNPFIPSPLQMDPVDYPFGGLFLSRDNIDLGLRGDDIERETQRAVFGLSGDAGDWATFQVSLNYGKTKVRDRQINNRFEDRFFAALDVIDNGGTPDCRVNTDPDLTPFDFPDPVTYDPAGGNCVPLNLFGAGVASPEAVAWVMGTTLATDKIEQQVLSGYLTGELPGIRVPGGPISWVAGGEYREESSEFTPDPFDLAGATFGNVIEGNYGEFDVREIFGELTLPVLAGRPLVEELTFELAWRGSDYSSIGSTGTWKAGAIWAPNPSVLLRATTSEAVRAPNIAEFFGADGQDFEQISDPCDINNLPLGTQYRAANCSALLTSFGVDPGTFTDPNSANVGGISSGNPNVREESADTETFGVVITPPALSNFSVALDYYNIELTDAIQVISAEEIATRCVDAPTLANEFCPLITRDPTTGGIDSFRQVPVNIAILETAGVDLTLNYSLNPSRSNIGTFDFRLIANRLHKLKFLPSPGGVVDDDVGEARTASFSGQAAPEYQASFDLSWNRGPLSLNYGFQWFDQTQRISNRSLNGDADLPGGNRDSIASSWYYFDQKLTHDIHANYELNNSISLFGGVRNFTDQKPAFDQSFYPVSPVGRAFYFGVEANLF